MKNGVKKHRLKAASIYTERKRARKRKGRRSRDNIGNRQRVPVQERTKG